MEIKVLISCTVTLNCAFVFSYAQSRFYNVKAHSFAYMSICENLGIYG